MRALMVSACPVILLGVCICWMLSHRTFLVDARPSNVLTLLIPPLNYNPTPRSPSYVSIFSPLLCRPCRTSLISNRYPALQPFVDETGAPATLPEEGNGGEESKMKVLLGLLRK